MRVCVCICVCVSLHPNVRPRSIFVVYYLFTCFPFLHSVSIVDPYFGASMVRRYVGTLVLGDLWGVHLQIFECFIFVIVPWDMSHPTPSHFHIVLYVVYLVWESRRKVWWLYVGSFIFTMLFQLSSRISSSELVLVILSRMKMSGEQLFARQSGALYWLGIFIWGHLIKYANLLFANEP